MQAARAEGRRLDAPNGNSRQKRGPRFLTVESTENTDGLEIEGFREVRVFRG
jgi:hypothetical protein